ncbi:MAG: ATP synthase F1 subunit gamma [Solirubrobacteraceae bacterium]|nr:ATP synthase F1 subunit gamma [Solirubrobacteraceae bacterium]
MSQRDVKQRIASIGNIKKITRAMEMVAAARLRKAEEAVGILRPYADAISDMTRQAAMAATESERRAFPLLQGRDEVNTVGILLVTGDRGLAGAFNSQIVRAAMKLAQEHEAQGRKVVIYATGRRGVSAMTFRGRTPEASFTGFTDAPKYANAREVAETLMAAYLDGKVDQVEVLFNHFVSALTQDVTQTTLLPLQEDPVAAALAADGPKGHHALVEYEPDPQDILERLIPDYVEIAIYRSLLDSAASEHGARMTAMRNASDNAGELITSLTLEMNRARQAEITQEIMEVVAGAEAI